MEVVVFVWDHSHPNGHVLHEKALTLRKETGLLGMFVITLESLAGPAH